MNNAMPSDISLQLGFKISAQVNSDKAVARFLAHLKVVENCCDGCRPLWRQWHSIASNTLQKTHDQLHHPFRAVDIGLNCLDKLSKKLFTDHDQALLMQIGIEARQSDSISSNDRLEALKIVDSRIGEAPHQAGAQHYAATHLIGKTLMRGVLTHFLKSEIRRNIVQRNRDYHAAVINLPPYRTVDGTAIVIAYLSVNSLESTNNISYSGRQVLPFTQADIVGSQRAALYHYLNCRRLTAADLPELEKDLIGQWGVFAAKKIPNKTCVGIYTGVIVPEGFADISVFDHDYLISLNTSINKREIFLDGDGITSKINTLVEYNSAGRPTRQAQEGYNIGMVKFSALLADSSEVAVIALFTLKEIPANTELRVNYQYRDEEVVRMYSSSTKG